ncbi:hypothetical protein RHMOL_Rhmol11G0246100 [Rhododendron molle]|uniref:Uncharacterized protein n=1 Tax=Rhododendron molle TaxID=49168 RepID=A0ACC0LW32_RHOML|nr:hypothetical protein RHMOL_Rhmol11G0246100 [Rhododendron molle]
MPESTAPKPQNPTHKKLPLLIYFHGGGFCIETAFSPTYHNYLNSLAAEANAVIVSVDYRRAPEYPLPIAYDDSWTAIKWAASPSERGGDEVWLNDYVDWDEEPIGKEGSNIMGKALTDNRWLFVCPSSSGSDDPLVNPVKDPNFSKLGCEKVLVCVAEKDLLRDRGWYYKEELENSGWWGGAVEIMEGKTMCSICLILLVKMLRPCSRGWLLS